MCGIAGIWNHKTSRPVDRERLRVITRALAHRGPDGEGFHIEGDLGLGHRRLSIIDLAGGHQPMCNEDGTVWIVFNGEIYNYPELRRELLTRGHVFRTTSDTEAIVHLYEDLGEQCFEKLRGMFALALWDRRNQKLLLARDRLGIKPLFYGLGPDGIVFGSELKCVRGSKLLELTINPTAIADLFACYYIPGPKTIYRDTYQLEPGHYLVAGRTGIRRQRYWDLTGEVLRLPKHAYVEQLHELLRETVDCHLLSDVPVGAFLSGGVDSSAIVALMSTLVREPIMTCSIGFPEEEYNEMDRARAVARQFGTDHHEHVVTPEPAKVLEALAEYYDQPFPDHSSIPTYYVSQLARQRVKVVLSGDGGDENFAGYSRYRRHARLEQIRRCIPSQMLAAFDSEPNGRYADSLVSRLRRVFHQIAIGAREGYLHAMTFADASLRAQLFSADLQRELAGYEPLDLFRALYDRAPAADPLSRIFYLDLKTWLVDDILTKVDRASMANSLEVRVPLLDHKVVEFAYALPLPMKLRAGQGKYLLRRAVGRYLPDDHLNLRKKGFTIPIVTWLRNELRAWGEETLFGSQEALPLLNPEGVRRLWENFQRGQSRYGDVLCIVLSYALSARVWAQTPSATTTRC